MIFLESIRYSRLLRAGTPETLSFPPFRTGVFPELAAGKLRSR